MNSKENPASATAAASPPGTSSSQRRFWRLGPRLQELRAELPSWVERLFAPGPRVAPQRSAPPKIGQDGKPLRVLAFAGGGWDTVMQLGVTHALLVSKAQAPDVVAGASAGALNAAALAEILQAGRPADGLPVRLAGERGDPRREQQLHDERVAQVGRFREFFESCLNLPEELLESALPDPNEVTARAPLQPLRLPTQNAQERLEREQATAARFGLVRLLNEALDIRLPISTFTQVIRRLLELSQLGEVEPSWGRRVLGQVREGIGLWWLAASRVLWLSPSLWRLGWRVALAGLYRKFLRFEEGGGAKELITRWKPLCAVCRLVQYLAGAGMALWLFLLLPLALTLLVSGGVELTARSALLAHWLTGDMHLAGWDQWGRAVEGGLLRWVQHGRGWSWVCVGLAVSYLPLLLFLGFHKLRKQAGAWALDRVLASFDLQADLLTPFILKPVLIRLFDPGYYGTREFDEVLNAALKKGHGPPAPGQTQAGKPLRDYLNKANMPIYVAPAVANISQVSNLAQIEVAGLEEQVVDALLAACAVTPLFRAQQLSHTAGGDLAKQPQYYVDASSIVNDPSFVILRQLRRIYVSKLARQERLEGVSPPQFDDYAERADVTLAEINGIEIYPVAPFPVARGTLEEPLSRFSAAARQTAGAGQKTYSGLVATALRALQLERFQDAALERKFINLYRRALPPEATFFDFVVSSEKSELRRVVARAQIQSIETEQALDLNTRILGTRDRDARRRLLAEGAADGCRAAMQVLMAATLQWEAGGKERGKQPQVVSCRAAVLRRLGARDLLPGSPEQGGPGLPEVCRHCCAHRHLEPPASNASPQAAEPKPHSEHHQCLEVPACQKDSTVVDWPIWQDEYMEAQRQPPSFKTEPCSHSADGGSEEVPSPKIPTWPRKRTATGELTVPPEPDANRPTISFLFSGGVFRGVFQLGVVSALSEAGLRPDLLAGASVGTITSAMVASVFTQSSAEARQAQLAKLCAVFLAVDRFVLTDRFADFVRHFTLRAADTRFSPRDADQFFRRYDEGRFGDFNQRARRVVAGLERLVHLNPFALAELTRALRARATGRAWRQLTGLVEHFLESEGVGQEILGAEPLAMLIEELVLPATGRNLRRAAQLDYFLESGGLHLLGTVTNLTQGTLETVSSLLDDRRGWGLLKEGLLASSAFPAVFRPRWSWEVYPQACTTEKFIDGGVMDNLPVDEVVRFLCRASSKGLLKLWPQGGPHLLFTASLQERQRELQGRKLARTATHWHQLWPRARKLSYNQKIDRFAEVQTNLRAIAQQRAKNCKGPVPPPDWDLLDIETVVVKPEWLVGTFAFHPMLGFRRRLQAASIAHGCAATLSVLHELQLQHKDWCESWGLTQTVGFRDGRAPRCGNGATHRPALLPLKRTAAEQQEGRCWFRNGNLQCPFARPLAKEKETREALTEIYQLCGKPCTHTREAPQRL